MGKVENRPFKWSVPDGADDAVTEQMKQTALFIRTAICRFCLEREKNGTDASGARPNASIPFFSLEVTPGFESPRGDFALC